MNMKNKPMMDNTVQPNNHHHIGYAKEFPGLTYMRMKNGKCFVYDNRVITHGQMPIAEMCEPNHLVINGKVVAKGTIRQLLVYCNEKILKRIVI